MTKERESVFDVIKRHWTNAPVDVFSIIVDAGLQFKIQQMAPELSGFIMPYDDTYLIGVNEKHPHSRQRFTAAHELGHYIYHRDLIGSGVDDTRLYRSLPGGKFYNSNVLPKHETQANYFAANLLMPNHLIRALQEEGKTNSKELAYALQVSDQAMRIKLGLPTEPTFFEKQGHEEESIEEIDGNLAFR